MLIHTDVTKYLEFKAVDGSYVLNRGRVEKVGYWVVIVSTAYPKCLMTWSSRLRMAPVCSTLNRGRVEKVGGCRGGEACSLWSTSLASPLFAGSTACAPVCHPTKGPAALARLLRYLQVPASDWEALKSPLMGLFEKRRAAKFFGYVQQVRVWIQQLRGGSANMAGGGGYLQREALVVAAGSERLPHARGCTCAASGGHVTCCFWDPSHFRTLCRCSTTSATRRPGAAGTSTA